MGQLDARLSRGYPAVGTTLERLPAMSAPSEWDGSFNRRKSDRVSPSRPVAPAANGLIIRGQGYRTSIGLVSNTLFLLVAALSTAVTLAKLAHPLSSAGPIGFAG